MAVLAKVLDVPVARLVNAATTAQGRRRGRVTD